MQKWQISQQGAGHEYGSREINSRSGQDVVALAASHHTAIACAAQQPTPWHVTCGLLLGVQVRNRLQALKEKNVEHDPDLTVADGEALRPSKMSGKCTL